jgi:hypothetical protein
MGMGASVKREGAPECLTYPWRGWQSKEVQRAMRSLPRAAMQGYYFPKVGQGLMTTHS